MQRIELTHLGEAVVPCLLHLLLDDERHELGHDLELRVDEPLELLLVEDGRGGVLAPQHLPKERGFEFPFGNLHGRIAVPMCLREKLSGVSCIRQQTVSCIRALNVSCVRYRGTEGNLVGAEHVVQVRV